MKLSVSNLAWPKEENDWCLEQLVNNGIQGVELAPLKVFDSWESISEQDITSFLIKHDALNLSVSSFQAITFGIENLALLGDKEKVDNFIVHMSKVALLLRKMKGKLAVFGSPALRDGKDHDSAALVELFDKVGEVFEVEQVKLALETVPSYYGCELLNQLSETEALISQLNHQHIVRHFDSACQYLSGDLGRDLVFDYLARSEHLHISEVDLADFSNPSKFNLNLASRVKEYYKGEWCVLEMSDKNYTREAFSQSIKNFSKLFSA